MKNIFKKNHIIITTLAIMIIAVGYLQYTGNKVDTEDLALEANTETAEGAAVTDISDEDIYAQINSAEPGETASVEEAVPDVAGLEEGVEGTELADIESQDLDLTTEAGETPGEAVLASTVTNVGFIAEARLSREQVRGKNKELLMEIINNQNISESQKQNAVDSMIAMTDIAEREAAAEILLEAKGFTDIVVSITDNTADVVVNMAEITDAKRAQIEDIMKRKTGVSAENIIITPINVAEQTQK